MYHTSHTYSIMVEYVIISLTSNHPISGYIMVGIHNTTSIWFPSWLKLYKFIIYVHILFHQLLSATLGGNLVYLYHVIFD